MPARRLVPILLAIWAAVWVASFWMRFALTPTGDGFTRGLNRLAGFLGCQALAALPALALWPAGRRLARGSLLRGCSLVPLALAGLLALGIAALILGARFGEPRPADPPAHPPAATVTRP